MCSLKYTCLAADIEQLVCWSYLGVDSSVSFQRSRTICLFAQLLLQGKCVWRKQMRKRRNTPSITPVPEKGLESCQYHRIVVPSSVFISWGEEICDCGMKRSRANPLPGTRVPSVGSHCACCLYFPAEVLCSCFVSEAFTTEDKSTITWLHGCMYKLSFLPSWFQPVLVITRTSPVSHSDLKEKMYESNRKGLNKCRFPTVGNVIKALCVAQRPQLLYQLPNFEPEADFPIMQLFTTMVTKERSTELQHLIW